MQRKELLEEKLVNIHGSAYSVVFLLYSCLILWLYFWPQITKSDLDKYLSGIVIDGEHSTRYGLLSGHCETEVNHAIGTLVVVERFHGDDHSSRRCVLHHEHLVQWLAKSRSVIIDVNDTHGHQSCASHCVRAASINCQKPHPVVRLRLAIKFLLQQQFYLQNNDACNCM